jgi:uracil-DNA glycosylase
VTKQRGEWIETELAEYATGTIHPSAILRQRDDESRHAEMAKLVADLKKIAAVL